MSATLAQMRDYLEEIVSAQNDTGFIDSTYQLQLLNKAYEKSAYKYNWPQTLKRWFDPLVANVDRYSLQSDWRKFIFVKQSGILLDLADVEDLKGGYNQYAVELDSDQYISALQPNAASDAYVTQNSESAGNAVVVELDTVDGLSAGDEIFISNTTSSEFTKIQSVDTAAETITVKLANSHTSGKSIYRVDDGMYMKYQKAVTALADTGDTPILPGETHLIIPHYAASLYYEKLEEPDRATQQRGIWENELSDIWHGLGKIAAGQAGEMVIG